MIGYVKGILEYSMPGKVIVEVNGFGINVIVSESTREELPFIGSEVKLFTYMNVREDDISLFGFNSEEALSLFNLLITVNGVGPKAALNILGTYSPAEIKYYIMTEDAGKLSKAPTIGKKIAERIILDLKDKVNDGEILKLKLDGIVSEKLSSDAKDAIDALIALGYDKKIAEASVNKIEHLDELDANQILKLALKYMF